MRRAQVLDVELQDELYPHMKDLMPLPSIYFPDFIAANQADRCVSTNTVAAWGRWLALRAVALNALLTNRKASICLPFLCSPHHPPHSADNVLQGSKQEQMEAVRGHIRAFKAQHGLDKVIVLWTANTERFAAIEEGA